MVYPCMYALQTVGPGAEASGADPAAAALGLLLVYLVPTVVGAVCYLRIRAALRSVASALWCSLHRADGGHRRSY